MNSPIDRAMRIIAAHLPGSPRLREAVREDLAAANLEVHDALTHLAVPRVTNRWSIQEQPDGSLMVCKGLHDKHEACDHVRFVPAPAPEHGSFTIGQPVKIRQTYRYWHEWREAKLFVCGIGAATRTGDLSYSVSEHWPPRDAGDVTTGFAAELLEPREVVDG